MPPPNRGTFRDQVNVLRRQFLQDGGLPFTNVLTEDVVTKALATAGRWRDRVFSPVVTLWVFLGQALAADPRSREPHPPPNRDLWHPTEGVDTMSPTMAKSSGRRPSKDDPGDRHPDAESPARPPARPGPVVPVRLDQQDRDALARFLAAQRVAPSVPEILRVALREFLAREGYDRPAGA